MPINLILDADSSKANGNTIFSSFEDIKAHITTVYGTNWNGNGTLTVTCQSSNGAAYVGAINVDGFSPTETDNMIIKAVKVNGEPFRQKAPVDNTASLLNLADDNVDVITELGTWILEADPDITTEYGMVRSSKTGEVEGLILEGGGTTTVSALYAASYLRTFRNCIVRGFNRGFYGAFRDGSDVLNIDHCVFIDNAFGRSANKVTNSVFVNTPISTQYGIHSSSNNNAYTQTQSLDMYSDGVMGDANSLFDLVFVDEMVNRADGGVNIINGSALATLASDGGPVGAEALIITPATITGDIVRGQSFDIVLEGHTAGPTKEWVEVIIKDPSDNAEYPCAINTYTSVLITATSPTAQEMPAIANAEVIIGYKSALGYFA